MTPHSYVSDAVYDEGLPHLVSPWVYVEEFVRHKTGEKPVLDKAGLDRGLKSWIDSHADKDRLEEKLTALGGPLNFAVAYLKNKKKKKPGPEANDPALAARDRQAMEYLQQQGIVDLDNENDLDGLGEEAGFILVEEYFFDTTGEPVFEIEENVFDDLAMDEAFEEMDGLDNEVELAMEEESSLGDTLEIEQPAAAEKIDAEPETEFVDAPAAQQNYVAAAPVIKMHYSPPSRKAMSDQYLQKAKNANDADEKIDLALTAAHLDRDNAAGAAHTLLNTIEHEKNDGVKTQLLGGVIGALGENQLHAVQPDLAHLHARETSPEIAGQIAHLRGNKEAPAVKSAALPVAAKIIAFNENGALAKVETPVVPLYAPPVAEAGYSAVPLHQLQAMQQPAEQAPVVKKPDLPSPFSKSMSLSPSLKPSDDFIKMFTGGTQTG